MPFLGEYCAEPEGVPSLDTVGYVLLAERGDPYTDPAGEDICMARTSDIVRKGGRGVLLVVGVNSSCSSYWEMSEILGDLVMVVLS